MAYSYTPINWKNSGKKCDFRFGYEWEYDSEENEFTVTVALFIRCGYYPGICFNMLGISTVKNYIDICGERYTVPVTGTSSYRFEAKKDTWVQLCGEDYETVVSWTQTVAADATGKATLTIDTKIRPYAFVSGTVYAWNMEGDMFSVEMKGDRGAGWIDTAGGWKQAIPYVDTADGWKQAIPYVETSTGFVPCGDGGQK